MNMYGSGFGIRRIEDLNSVEKTELKLKWWWINQIIKSRKKIDKEQYIVRSDFEKEAVGICRNLIKRQDSKLLGSFKTQKRYVKNDVLGMNIIIEDGNVDIINHTYQYNVPISIKSHKIISNIFDGHQDADRQQMENEIRSNVKHSLQTIYEKIKN